jgi:predicted dehydrogenase
MTLIRWGIIGCGDIVQRRVAPAIQALDGSLLQAIARRNPAKRIACQADLHVPDAYADWRELVSDPKLEAIYIATPVYLHCEQIIAAAANGKHVLSEKPLGMNVKQCLKAIDACRTAGVKLGVAYYRHFYPSVKRIKALIDSGRLGDIILARVDAAETFLPDASHPRRWILDKAQAGGGSLMDFGCHRIEVLINLLGPVKSATGVIGKVYAGHDVEDTASVAMAFNGGANGVVNVIRGGTQERDTLYIEGTLGTVWVENLNGGWLTICDTQAISRETRPCHENAHLPLIDNFSTALRLDQTPAVNGQTGLQVQEVIEAVYG